MEVLTLYKSLNMCKTNCIVSKKALESHERNNKQENYVSKMWIKFPRTPLISCIGVDDASQIVLKRHALPAYPFLKTKLIDVKFVSNNY